MAPTNVYKERAIARLAKLDPRILAECVFRAITAVTSDLSIEDRQKVAACFFDAEDEGDGAR